MRREVGQERVVAKVVLKGLLKLRLQLLVPFDQRSESLLSIAHLLHDLQLQILAQLVEDRKDDARIVLYLRL